MTAENNHPTPDKQPPLSPEEIQRRLKDTHTWLQKILAEHEEIHGRVWVSATTEEGWDTGVLGTLSVGQGENELYVELEDTMYGDEAQRSGHGYVERYILAGQQDGYVLETSGRLPDVATDVLLQADIDEEAFYNAVHANAELVDESMHDADDAEIKRFYDLVSLGAFGDDPLDTDDLDWQAQAWHDDETAKQSANQEQQRRLPILRRFGRWLLGREH